MSASLETRCRNLLVELGVIQPKEAIEVEPLTGGVASDIAVVTVGSKKLCVKFALPKLKVQETWLAPVHRNAAEYAWLKVAASVAPDAAVALLGQSRKLHGFAMEYVDGADVYLWKANLLSEAPDNGEATSVGELLGRIHAASTHTEFKTSDFQNRDDFHALRIEPYLLHTSFKHKDVSEALDKAAKELYRNQQVLIHGDVSPKNILFRAGKAIILDAECATMGDASFDVSFCLNHLVLKAIHLPDSKERYLTNALDLWQAYRPSISWEPMKMIESRICILLPMLMLARVDGKSPVEYLTASEGEIVRQLSLRLIKSPVDQLEDLLRRIDAITKEHTA